MLEIIRRCCSSNSCRNTCTTGEVWKSERRRKEIMETSVTEGMYMCVCSAYVRIEKSLLPRHMTLKHTHRNANIYIIHIQTHKCIHFKAINKSTCCEHLQNVGRWAPAATAGAVYTPKGRPDLWYKQMLH